MSITEAELAAAGAAYFSERGWAVSHEVMLESSLRRGSDVGLGRADFVVQCKSLTGVVEAKLGLGFPLLAQLYRWRELTNVTWALVPEAREDDGRLYAFRVCRMEGFGLLEYGADGVHERIPPTTRTDVDLELVQSIRPEHQGGRFAKAGQSGGANLVTPGNLMEAALIAYVAAHPGQKLEEAVANIKHPFQRDSRAIEILSKKVRREEIEGVYRGQFQRLFPTRESARTGMVEEGEST